MIVANTLTVADLATHLTEVLDRAHAGERIAIEGDGKLIATTGPPSMTPEVTLRELAAKLALLPPLDDDFAADIEAARAILLPAEVPKWRD